MPGIPARSVASTLAFAAALALAGCTTDPARPAGPGSSAAPSAPAAGKLAGTSWKLVGFQSMDDAQGTTRPPAGRVYTLEFGNDGDLAMQLDCNRGRSGFVQTPSSATSGTLAISLVATTRAFCEQPDMGQMLAARLPEVASYVLRDGHLFLALKMDSGIFEFAPL